MIREEGGQKRRMPKSDYKVELLRRQAVKDGLRKDGKRNRTVITGQVGCVGGCKTWGKREDAIGGLLWRTVK